MSGRFRETPFPTKFHSLFRKHAQGALRSRQGALSIRRDAALPWCTQFIRWEWAPKSEMQVS